jgi:methionyl-tRNA synthetase
VLLDGLRAHADTVATLYEEREFGKALREVMLLADKVNEYVDRTSPGRLAKQAGQDAALHDVCSVCIEAFKLLTLYLKPVLPALAAQVEAFLQIEPLKLGRRRARRWASHTIGEYKHLMQRVDPKQLDALFEPPPGPGQRRCCPVARHWRPRSASTTSPRSTCASPASWPPSASKAAPSCCA